MDDDSARQGGATPTPSSRPIAVLSFFCGIGTTFLAVRDLGVSPVLSWCWELDEECKRVTSGHSPRVRHWGDALASDPQWTAQLLQAHGPTDTLVLVCASPPCTDFSQMRSQQPGLSGSEGCKFKEWVKWFQTFRSALQNQHILLLENVIPSVVSRPRLWWSNVLQPPQRTTPVSLRPSWLDLPDGATTGPGRSSGAPVCSHVRALQSARQHHSTMMSCSRASQPQPRQQRDATRRTRGEGQRAPKPSRGGRRLPVSTRHTSTGSKIQGQWRTPDATTCEWLQGLPKGVPTPPGPQLSERSRCKMLGNAWHLPTARFILFVLLASCNVTPVSAGPVQEWYPPSCPLPWRSNQV